MLAALLPLLAVAASGATAPAETVNSPRAAQARLAASLASATSIDSVTANDHAVTFTLHTRHETLQLVARIDTQGAIQSLTVTDLGPEKANAGSLSWLAPALADTSTVTALAVDAEGRVRLTTGDGRDYLLLASHSEQVTNTGVEAMWAAAWDR